MTERGRFGISNEYVSLPTEVTEYDLSKLGSFLKEGRNIGESTALTILSEAKRLAREEFEAWQQSGGEVDFTDNAFISWVGYTAASVALLNAIELLRNGRPFQDPNMDQDLALQVLDRKMMAELWQTLGIAVDMEPVIATDVAEWHIRQQGQLSLLLEGNNTLQFIDKVTQKAKEGLHPGSRDNQRRKIALDHGRLRFHSLYTAAGFIKD